MKTTIRINLMGGDPNPSELLKLSETELHYYDEIEVNQGDTVEIRKSGYTPIILAKVLSVETTKDYKILKVAITTGLF